MSFELKTEPEQDREERRGMLWAVLFCVVFYGGIALAIIALMSGCTLTVAPDGTRTYGTDGEQVMRAIEILAEK